MTVLLFAGGHDPGVMSAYLLLLLRERARVAPGRT